MKSHHLIYGFFASLIGFFAFFISLLFVLFDSRVIYLTFVSFVVMCLGAPYFWFVVPEREKERAKYLAIERNQVSPKFCGGCGCSLIVGAAYCINCSKRIKSE